MSRFTPQNPGLREEIAKCVAAHLQQEQPYLALALEASAEIDRLEKLSYELDEECDHLRQQVREARRIAKLLPLADHDPADDVAGPAAAQHILDEVEKAYAPGPQEPEPNWPTSPAIAMEPGESISTPLSIVFPAGDTVTAMGAIRDIQPEDVTAKPIPSFAEEDEPEPRTIAEHLEQVKATPENRVPESTPVEPTFLRDIPAREQEPAKKPEQKSRGNGEGSVGRVGKSFRGRVRIGGQTYYTRTLATEGEVERHLTELIKNPAAYAAKHPAHRGRPPKASPFDVSELNRDDEIAVRKDINGISIDDTCAIIKLAGDGLLPEAIAEESMLPMAEVQRVYAREGRRIEMCQGFQTRDAARHWLAGVRISMIKAVREYVKKSA